MNFQNILHAATKDNAIKVIANASNKEMNAIDSVDVSLIVNFSFR